jgi:hypothetical protein
MSAMLSWRLGSTGAGEWRMLWAMEGKSKFCCCCCWGAGRGTALLLARVLWRGDCWCWELGLAIGFGFMLDGEGLGLATVWRMVRWGVDAAR